MKDQFFLTEKEVAKRFGISIHTLRGHRQKGVGFPYRRLEGRILYSLDECLEAIEKTKVTPHKS